MTVSDSVLIDADPVTVYDRVSDPTQMGVWSPENLGATVHEPTGEAYVGMVFDGRNKRGPSRWTTRCTVTAADRGQRFAFRVRGIGIRTPLVRTRIATWDYHLAPEAGGTRVTETWHDDRQSWPDTVAAVFDRLATGNSFAEFQRKNIHITLRNLKRVIEGPLQA